MAELVHLFGPFQVFEPMHSQVAERNVRRKSRREVADGAAEQRLPCGCNPPQASTSIYVGAVIIVAVEFTSAGMQCGSHSDISEVGPRLTFQGSLKCARALYRIGGVCKNGECAVALATAADNKAAMLFNAADDYLRMARNGPAHRFRV